MINREILKELLDLPNRQKLFDKILNNLKKYDQLKKINYSEFDTSEGKIPFITIAESSDPEETRYVKVFVGAQHNEYNGLFGILDFLNMVGTSVINIDEILLKNQVLVFAPLMNPYGFLNPRSDNKSGYYLKNGTNLNRYWRKTFAPEYKDEENDFEQHPLPEHTKLLKNILRKFWENDKISIYMLDFHETSLLERFTIDLVENLKTKSITYKFSHWLKEGMVYNIIKLYKIPFSRKPLFYKCNPNADHTHINLTMKQLDKVYEKLQEHISSNLDKLPFYFCYSNRSKNYCERLARNVYNKLKNILWETYFPAFNHSFIHHGCLVNMNDAVMRKRVYSMELESQKQFFNIFDEIEKSKASEDYFDKKLKKINMSIKLIIESIKEMIFLF